MFPRMSGATIRDTLIGVLRPLLKTQTPDKTTEPTKAHGLLPLQRKGKDSKKPSVWPIRTPLRPTEQYPPRSRVADLPSSGSLISASLEGSPRDPRPHKRISASLEDSGPALERVANLRLARGQRTCPRAGGQSPPRSRPSLGTRDKRPRRPTDRRTKAL